MTESTERAILAGGCFLGRTRLAAPLSGGHLDAGRVFRRRRAQCDLPQSRNARRSGRDHLRSQGDRLPRHFGLLLSDPRSIDAQPPGQRSGHELPFRDLLHERTSKSKSPRTRSPTSMPRGSGPVRSSRRSLPPATSGKPNRNIKIIWSGIRRATPVTSSGRTGSCPHEPKHGKWASHPRCSFGRLPMVAPAGYGCS